MRGNAKGDRAAVARGFAPHQVIGLDGGGAFVNGEDARVAVVLGHASFFDEAHATVDLHRQRGDLQAHLGAKAFNQRHHEFIKAVVRLAGLCVEVVVRDIKRTGRRAGHGPAALGVGAHGHQHAAHIGVVDDGCAAVHGAVHRAALHALAGKRNRFLVSPVRNRNALNTHGKTGGVHHDEHVLQAPVLLAHQVTHCTGTSLIRHTASQTIAVLQHRSGAGFDAQLVLDADALHIVARAQAAVGIHQHFWHHKQADALDAFGRTLYPRQHQMDDVLGHVVLTPGDVNLGAENLVETVGLRLGPGAHQGQVAAGLRLGQVHGAGPGAGNQLLQVGGFEFVRTSGEQRFNRAVTQQGAQRKAQACSVQHFVASRADDARQALPAPLGRMLQALPATLHKLLKSLLEARGCGDHAMAPCAGVDVALPIQRGYYIAGKFGRFVQNRLRGVQRGVFKSGELGDLVDTGDVFQIEQHVLHGSGITHKSPALKNTEAAPAARPTQLTAPAPSRARR